MHTSKRWAVLLVLVFGAVLFFGCGRDGVARGGGSPAGVLTVYVPCGMELPFRAAKEAFEKAHPGVEVRVLLDNANVLVRMVLDKGNLPDLIVSPGSLEMKQLEAAGAVLPDAVQPFGRFELVLFTPRNNPGEVAIMGDLLNDKVTNIAIADPKDNSVGRYTMQALQAAGLWDQLQDKLTFWDHPITAYQHVARERAQASFAYRSCPLKTAPDKLEYSRVRIRESVPLDSYDPAFACIAPLVNAAQPELARQFIASLLTTEGQKLLDTHDIPALPKLTLFVPCGMVGPFHRLRQTFRERHPGILVDLIFDRADALNERILEQGETPDLHVSIGAVETRQLVAAGVVDPAQARPLGRFHLALCANRAKMGGLAALRDLAKPEIGRIVLTPTENSSVGYYARQALEKAGLWETVKDKIDYLPTIKDCYHQLSSGKADAGFAYIGCPLPADPAKAEYSKVQVVEVLSEESYGPAIVSISRLQTSRHPVEAELLVEALLEPESMQALAAVGLIPLDR